ncbi:MAG: RnfABCDGE type electron transport complex subunit G [Desulfobacula sp.]|nr:RnfABCDGE type electron transport complex subunit G [Desulfobacula sp.]
MREMISMIVVLTVLTSVSGLLLAAVHSGTAVQIENQVLKFEKAPAIESIFPDVANDPIADRFTIKTEEMKLQVFPTKLSNGANAVAFETKGTGFGGPVGLMVAVNLDNDEIVDVRMTAHAETPGIGTKPKEDLSFVSQFTGLPIMDTDFNLKGSGGVIDAVSGATVTSNALCTAAVQAKEVYQKLKPEIIKQMK